MEDISGCSYKKPPEVFNTLAKIRAASYRVGFNIWDLYKPLDPDNNKLISVSKFISVLGGPLKDIVGLANEEIITVAQYFRQADGRVMYHQFCNLVHGGDEVQEKGETKAEESEVEIFQRNKLIPEEEKQLLMMLTKIAILVNRKKMILKPFFQDYSLVRKGSGLVSRSRLARVLNQVGVQLSSRDYNLLLRKYSTDSFTLSYVAFLEDLETVRKYLDEHDTLDVSGDLLPKFSGRLAGWELPQLPRPETVEAQEGLVGLPALKLNKQGLSVHEINFALSKIRSHLHREKLLVGPLLKKYDGADSGRITQAQLRLVLSQLSHDSRGSNHLTLTTEEVVTLGKLFADPADGERILWRAFARDIHNDLTPEEMEKWPQEREIYLMQVAERKARERSALRWAQMDHPASPPASLQNVLSSIKKRLVKRNIMLKPSFLKYDRESLGIVNRNSLRKAMVDNCILCTEDEYLHLESQYIKGGFFNYTDMLLDLDKTSLPDSSLHQDNKNNISNNYIEKLEKDKDQKEATRESDIIEILAKIKGKLICAKMRTRNYLKPLDKEGSGLLSVEAFKTTLDSCQINLTPREFETVLSVFQDNKGLVEYLKFCNTVDEESERPCLFRLPLKEAMAKRESGPEGFKHPFLNYDERRIASVVAKKLCDKLSLGQLDAFKAIDTYKTGLISKSQLMSQLHLMGILHILTMDELDTVIKAFGVIPEGQTSYSLDYLAFLNALDIVDKKYKAANQ